MKETLLLEKSWPLLETSRATIPAACDGLMQRTALEVESIVAGVSIFPNLQVA
jgi:hypothetical protein